MNPGQKRDRQAPIDLKKKRTGEMQGEVEIAVRKCFGLLHASIRLNVNDVCEPLVIQQVADHVLRAMQMVGFFASRIVVVSGGLSPWALSRAATPQNSAVEAAQHPANSKSRRFVCIRGAPRKLVLTVRSGGRTSGRRCLTLRHR